MALACSLLNPRTETKIVTKVQERVRTITKIKVSPDGTKETIIDETSEKDTTVDKQSTSKQGNKTWTVFGTATSGSFPNLVPTYGIGVTRNILLGLSAGAYGTNKGEVGLALSYSF